jgi:gamma-glutamyltranspeptidase/glutathione hydrolase
MAARGGLISEKDLASYRAVVREPLIGSYRGYRIITTPPPSSGGVALLASLNILEAYDLAGLGAGSSAAIHLIAEAERRAFADRTVHLGDPDFVEVPTRGLVSKSYAALRRSGLDPRRATPSREVPAGDPWPFQGEPSRGVTLPAVAPSESEDTNHFSVVDAGGNAVAMTTTLNSNFGARRVARGTGILLNNEMDDFAVAPNLPNQFGLLGGRANAMEPGKRMLSSMVPTLVEKDGQLLLVAGAPGGPTIISTVLQIVINVVDFRMDPMAAVCAPRIHHQWLPDRILVEPGALAADVARALEERGHRLEEKRLFGGAHVIGRDEASGEWLGAADPRRHGSARGE